MKNAILAVFAGLVLTGVPQVCLAGGCRAYTPYVAEKKVVVVEKAVVAIAEYIAVPVAVPLYSVGYAAAAPVVAAAPVAVGAPPVQVAPAQYAATAPIANQPTELDALRARIQQLEQQLAAGGNRVGTPAPAASAAWDLLKTKCASCHSDAGAKGNVRLFQNGQPVKLVDDQLAKVLRVTKGKAGQPPQMPRSPGKALTDEEYSVLLDLLDG